MIPIQLIRRRRSSHNLDTKKNSHHRMMCPVLTKSQFNFQNIDSNKASKGYSRLTKRKYFKIGIMNL
jgi:hypothetical protein